MNRVTLDAGRHSAGVAIVEVNQRRVGSVRRFGREDWRAKLMDDTEYPETRYRTRADAVEAVVAMHAGAVVSG